MTSSLLAGPCDVVPPTAESMQACVDAHSALDQVGAGASVVAGATSIGPAVQMAGDPIGTSIQWLMNWIEDAMAAVAVSVSSFWTSTPTVSIGDTNGNPSEVVDWVQSNLAKSKLDPNSPQDNVKAGVLYLRSLLRSSGGDPATAAAGYYQGPASVARIGMLPETKRYVDNVMALRSRFGG